LEPVDFCVAAHQIPRFPRLESAVSGGLELRASCSLGGGEPKNYDRAIGLSTRELSFVRIANLPRCQYYNRFPNVSCLALDPQMPTQACSKR
jgi:hypothetical protein